MSRLRHLQPCAFVCLGLFAALPARADGGFVSGNMPPIERGQAAFLKWDAAAQRETLILQVSFEFTGLPEDFGWIVAVPSLPQLALVDPTPFPALRDLTRPLQRTRGVDCWGSAGHFVSSIPPPADGPVDVLGSETLGIYEALTVAASEADALLDSLVAWDFLYSANDALVRETLQYYVDKSWVFVVLRTDSPLDPPGHQSGSLAPLRLDFAAESPVYPLRISRISTEHENWVDLYAIADRRQEAGALRTQYANAIDNEELAAIEAQYPPLADLLAAGDFLTRLEGGLYSVDMEEDLELQPAALNSEYLEIYYSGWPLAEALGLLALAGLRWVRLGRSRPRVPRAGRRPRPTR
jgi:hypothetical protein